MGFALDNTRPVFMPTEPEKWLGAGGPSWTDVFGLALSTDEYDEIILVDDLLTDIIP